MEGVAKEGFERRELVPEGRGAAQKRQRVSVWMLSFSHFLFRTLRKFQLETRYARASNISNMYTSLTKGEEVEWWASGSRDRADYGDDEVPPPKR